MVMRAVSNGGSAAFNPASPGAIGGTTPAAGTFTTLAGTTSVTPGTGGAILGVVSMDSTADQSLTTNTALTNATGLSFAIAANERWIADFFVDVGAALSTTGNKLAVTIPSGATLNATAVYVDTGATGITVGNRTTTGGGDFGNGATDFTTAVMNTAILQISVWVSNGATPGTVALQFAQATSSGTALTWRKGSHGVAWRRA